MKTASKKKLQPKNTENQYSFVSRFGIIADSGTTTIPRLITNHYAELGVKPQIAMLIVHIYDFKWDSRDPYPSLEKVAKLMGRTRRAINKYLEELKDKKLLDVYARFDPQLGQQTNVYDFSRLVDKVVELEEKKLEKPDLTMKVTTPLNKRSSPPLNKRSNEKEEVKKEEIISKKKISKFENWSRGGEIKKLSVLLPQVSKPTQIEALEHQSKTIPPSDEERSVLKKSPQKKSLQPSTALSKLDAVIIKISGNLSDTKHELENRKQIENIYALLQKKGISQDDLIDTMLSVAGQTEEIKSKLEIPMAYFFTVLRDRWKLSSPSPYKSQVFRI